MATPENLIPEVVIGIDSLSPKAQYEGLRPVNDFRPEKGLNQVIFDSCIRNLTARSIVPVFVATGENSSDEMVYFMSEVIKLPLTRGVSPISFFEQTPGGVRINRISLYMGLLSNFVRTGEFSLVTRSKNAKYIL